MEVPAFGWGDALHRFFSVYCRLVKVCQGCVLLPVFDHPAQLHPLALENKFLAS